MCKAFLGSPQYDDINDDVLVNSEHEIFDLSTSDESPLVDFCDLAAPKEVSFIRIDSHSQPRNLVPLVFVFDSCFRIMAFRFRLDMPVVFVRPHLGKSNVLLERPRPKPRGQASHRDPLPTPLSIGVARGTSTDAP